MLEDQGIKAYVKYNYFDKDAKTGIPSISLSKTEVAKHRTKAYKLLTTNKRKELRKQRCHDVETVLLRLNTTKAPKMQFAWQSQSRGGNGVACCGSQSQKCSIKV